MKRLILVFTAILIGVSSFAQASAKDTPEAQWSHKDSLAIHLLNRISQHTAPYYKLYPTENMWTFLELETFSGRIYQVQFSTKGADYRYKTVLNGYSLVSRYDSSGEFACKL